MRHLIPSNKHFKHFKEAWETTKDDVELFDIEIYDILQAINKLPGIVTVFSCAGHHEDPDESEQFYITCAVTVEGVKSLQSFYSELRNELASGNILDAFHLRLISNVLLWGVRDDSDESSATIWNCWTLKGFLSSSEKTRVIACFEKVLGIGPYASIKPEETVSV